MRQNKDASRQLALKRYAAAAHLLTRKKDDGRSDALLIVLWADHQVAMGKAA